MPFRFFRSEPEPEAVPPAVPEGVRVYAIGDVHGCLAEFDDLLERIRRDDAQRDPAHSVLILLGDLVDRGPDSAGVIERVIDLLASESDIRVIGGNHEEIFRKAATGDPEALRFFTQIGGCETILSYGMQVAEYDRSNYSQLAARLAALVPDEHIAFLERLEDMVEIGDYAFVHAGIRPGVALDAQRASELRWIRAPFLDSERDHGKVIVHGDSISEDVEERANRIGIDTGCFSTGRLTALGLEGTERWYLSTGG